jgi:hypothetical protein
MSFEIPRFEPVDEAPMQADMWRDPNMMQELRQLPFVPDQKIVRPVGVLTTTFRDVTVPVARLVSSPRRMQNWAGDGAPPKHLPGGDIDSLEYALQLAASEGYKRAPRNGIVSPFVDSAGEIWGYIEDGTYRVMAAKMRGDETMVVDLKWPKAGQEFSRYDGRVLDLFNH